MSHVRMCDRCGNIFSENEENWSTQTASVMRRDETGRQKTVEIAQDTCPKCTNKIFQTPKVAGIIQAAPVDEETESEPRTYEEYLSYKAKHGL